jgi:hypothetical protein
MHNCASYDKHDDDGHVHEASLDGTVAPVYYLVTEPGVLQRSVGRCVVGFDDYLPCSTTSRSHNALPVVRLRSTTCHHALATLRAHQRDANFSTTPFSEHNSLIWTRRGAPNRSSLRCSLLA